MKVDHNVELLAPAGSYEAFEAALGAGADAVYVGGPEFGARAYAHNFTQDELLQAIDTVHIHGKKLYLTVNTGSRCIPVYTPEFSGTASSCKYTDDSNRPRRNEIS